MLNCRLDFFVHDIKLVEVCESDVDGVVLAFWNAINCLQHETYVLGVFGFAENVVCEVMHSAFTVLRESKCKILTANLDYFVFP